MLPTLAALGRLKIFTLCWPSCTASYYRLDGAWSEASAPVLLLMFALGAPSLETVVLARGATHATAISIAAEVQRSLEARGSGVSIVVT